MEVHPSLKWFLHVSDVGGHSMQRETARLLVGIIQVLLLTLAL